MDARELAEQQLSFISEYVGAGSKDMAPMLVVCNSGKVAVIVLVVKDHREITKLLMESSQKQGFEWLVVMHEAYTKKFKTEEAEQKMSGYRRGMMAEEFKQGATDVREVIVVQAYVKKEDGKLDRYFIVIDKISNEKIGTNEFDGYLTIEGSP